MVTSNLILPTKFGLRVFFEAYNISKIGNTKSGNLKNETENNYYIAIAKCDRSLLQSESGITKCDKRLLQSVSGITKCDKLLLQSVSGIIKCDRLLLQSMSGITKCDSY